MKRTLRYLLIGFFSLLVIILAVFLVWASTPPNPEEPAIASLSSDDKVQVIDENNWLSFLPVDSPATTGLILYPGGRVDYRSYAAHTYAIAEQGYLVTIVNMPLNFAFLGVNRANDVIEAYPEITHWTIGGHSLGGAMAAQYIGNHPEIMDGLVLWASYPAESNDLSGMNLSVISIYASNDGLATMDEIESSRDNLPPDTQFFEIPGGNHAGFGWYGPQNGDGESQISQGDQQFQIINATVAFLKRIGE
jgi:pimeloyl-ACP methyl ester carboxylesterase